MPELISFLSLESLDGNRTFSILFGTFTSGACLALALPTLYWCLPGSRRWIFNRAVDRRQVLQAVYGVMCMAMAFANALCRYIPHERLGWVHESFLVTTIGLVALVAGRVLPVVRHHALEGGRVYFPGAFVAAILPLVGLPLAALAQAFRV